MLWVWRYDQVDEMRARERAREVFWEEHQSGVDRGRNDPTVYEWP